MAVATATGLDIHIGGKLLFADVSFKLEPGERMTLSGSQRSRQVDSASSPLRRAVPRRAARWLSKEAPGVALHDQRPPTRAKISLGDYVFSGRSDMQAIEAELARLEETMSERQSG